MRAALTLLTVLLLAVPAASAELVTVLQDSSGPSWVIAGQGSEGPTRNPSLDLVALAAEETAETIEIHLEVASLSDPGETFVVDDGRYIVHVAHGGRNYLAIMFHARADQDYWWGTLQQWDWDTQQATFLRPLTVWSEGNVIRTSIEREQLLDEHGAAPLPGRELTDWWAQARHRTADGFIGLGCVSGNCVRLGGEAYQVDVMPDDGPGGQPLAIEMGPQQSGDATLFATRPMRASNGEATTHVFTLDLAHAGAEDALYSIAVAGAPGNWEIRIPQEVVRVPAGGSVEIPILVSTPFAHAHGAVHRLDVTARNQDDAGDVGRAEIGVRFHEIPQPAGHHDTLYFHSARFGDDNQFFVITDNLFAGNSGNVFLNTQQDDANDQQVPIKGQWQGWGFHGGRQDPASLYQWFAFLSPDLQMGLDFDLSEEGALSMPFRSPVTLVGAQVSANLVHWGFDQASATWTRTVPAQVGPSEPIDLDSHVFEFTFPIDESADLIPRYDVNYFGLEINMTSTSPHLFTGAEAPELMPGGTMQLPLNEYHAPLDEVFAALGVRLELPDQRAVAPGSSIVYRGAIVNDMDRDETFHIATTGSDWASLPVNRILVPAGDSRPVEVVMAAPLGAKAGDVATVIVEAWADSDPSKRTLARLTTTVDPAAVADEAATLSATQNAPLAPLAGLGAIGLAALGRRRTE